MPKFLIVAATKFEVQPLLDHFKILSLENEGLFRATSGVDISVTVTGVGMVNTAFAMGKLSGQTFDHLINIGICGAFDRELKQGEIVNVVSDTLSEMGAEDGNEFINYEDMKLGGTNTYRSFIEKDNGLLDSLKKVKGITVNKVHGNEESISKVKNTYNPQVESMEGAAFFRGCQGHSGNYYQLRAISNYVEKRDKSKWNIPVAIKNINEFVIKLITELDS
ncbi:MAG: mqnB [Bacteroidetes bacterium]|jgi:futalosine hydrolase|nr:mqnB [Bacteroidota bacterium]